MPSAKHQVKVEWRAVEPSNVILQLASCHPFGGNGSFAAASDCVRTFESLVFRRSSFCDANLLLVLHPFTASYPSLFSSNLAPNRRQLCGR